MNASTLTNDTMRSGKSKGVWSVLKIAGAGFVALALAVLTSFKTASAQPFNHPPTAQVVGSTWQGTETYHGHSTPITIWFRPNHEVAVSCQNGNHQQVTYYGTYTQALNSNQVTLNLPTIQNRFNGTILVDPNSPGVQSGGIGNSPGPILLQDLIMQGQGYYNQPGHAPHSWTFKVNCTVYGPQQH
jgi:hypothetical protein